MDCCGTQRNLYTCRSSFDYLGQCFQNVFFADPFWLRKITTDPHILAQVNIHCPDDRYPKLKIYISKPILVSFEYIPVVCGNKMPSRCNRGFYCRSYCLLNMFRAPPCQSSGAQEYYTVVAACGISCCGFQVAGLVWS